MSVRSISALMMGGDAAEPNDVGHRILSWLLVLTVCAPLVASGRASTADLPGSWRTLSPAPIARQEASYVKLDGRFHVLGGNMLRHDVYDPATGDWTTAAPLPVRLHHVQAVTARGRIFIVGGLQQWLGPALDSVYIYDPVADGWTEGAPMPRPRGAGGVAVWRGSIYYAGGLNEGEAVPFFDVYRIGQDRWEALPDMPVARDHFQAAVMKDRLYVIGGRQVGFGDLVARTDLYNLGRERWRAGPLPPIPTPRGGYAVAELGGRIFVFGGEGGGEANPAVEAFDPVEGSWSAYEPMTVPRHGLQAVRCGGGIYLATGSDDQGPHPTAVHDMFSLRTGAGCDGPD